MFWGWRLVLESLHVHQPLHALYSLDFAEPFRYPLLLDFKDAFRALGMILKIRKKEWGEVYRHDRAPQKSTQAFMLAISFLGLLIDIGNKLASDYRILPPRVFWRRSKHGGVEGAGWDILFRLPKVRLPWANQRPRERIVILRCF